MLGLPGQQLMLFDRLLPFPLYKGGNQGSGSLSHFIDGTQSPRIGLGFDGISVSFQQKEALEVPSSQGPEATFQAIASGEEEGTCTHTQVCRQPRTFFGVRCLPSHRVKDAFGAPGEICILAVSL